ncbi:MAG: hypothetical protein ACYC8T_35530, partial [Myxococcaceae bacterium]
MRPTLVLFSCLFVAGHAYAGPPPTDPVSGEALEGEPEAAPAAAANPGYAAAAASPPPPPKEE